MMGFIIIALLGYMFENFFQIKSRKIQNKLAYKKNKNQMSLFASKIRNSVEYGVANREGRRGGSWYHISYFELCWPCDIKLGRNWAVCLYRSFSVTTGNR